MKKTVKILSIVLLVVLMLSFVSTNVFAWDASSTINNINSKSNTELKADDGIIKTAGNIMGWIRNIAVIVAVIIIMVLGIKYMLGSVEEKAEYKKSFVPLIVGIVLVVAATSIATFLFDIAG